MITIPTWQLVLFVVAGVAVGAIVVMLTVAKSRPTEVKASTTSRTSPPAERERTVATPAPVVERHATDPATVLAAAESRQEKVKTILNKRVSQKRNLTIDEAAKCLNVSPRRVRKLLEKGTLVPILMSDSSRQVSSVSVLDLIVRREAVGAEQENGEGITTVYVSDKDRAKGEKGEKPAEKPEPGPRQMYWYYVAGYDKPLHTLREALGVLGLEYPGADWTGIPSKVKKKIQRERIGT